MASKLTPKQAAFVAEYLVDLNATQAAIRSGYSKRTARAIGAENLTKPAIAAAITAAQAGRAKRVEVTADRILEELAFVGFSRITDFAVNPDTGDLTIGEGADPEAVRAVRALEHTLLKRIGRGASKAEIIKTKLRLWDKLGALKLMGQHLGMFKQQIEVEATGGVLLVPAATAEAWAEAARTQQGGPRGA